MVQKLLVSIPVMHRVMLKQDVRCSVEFSLMVYGIEQSISDRFASARIGGWAS